MNIDILRSRNPMTRQYQAVLDAFGFHQMIKQPTRITKTSRTIIDHIVTSHPQRATHSGVIPCAGAVSDHDSVFACVNVRIYRFQPRYKFIRNEKTFDTQAFQCDFHTLPLEVVYGTESPDDMVDAMNTLFTECLDRHAPLRKTKVTRSPAPWLNEPGIRELQTERDKLRTEAHRKADDESWAAFRAVRNKIKTVINKARRSFLVKALSSKRPKVVWQVIHPAQNNIGRSLKGN